MALTAASSMSLSLGMATASTAITPATAITTTVPVAGVPQRGWTRVHTGPIVRSRLIANRPRAVGIRVACTEATAENISATRGRVAQGSAASFPPRYGRAWGPFLTSSARLISRWKATEAKRNRPSIANRAMRPPRAASPGLFVSSLTLNAASQPQKKNTARTMPWAKAVPPAISKGLNQDSERAWSPVIRAQPQKASRTVYSKTRSANWKRVAARTPVTASAVRARRITSPTAVVTPVDVGSRAIPATLCRPALSAKARTTEPMIALV
ncbi:hypothetical protein RKD46_001215 [Streptomyces pseudovenezuelae]